ncbi:MAG: lipase family protein [Verrucomicrobiota bacterium]
MGVLASGKPGEDEKERSLSFDALFGPNTVYDYLEGVNEYPFDEDAEGESLRNAWWLARLSMLVYVEDETFVKERAGVPEDRVYVLKFEGRLRGVMVRLEESILVVFQGTKPKEIEDWMTDLSVVKKKWMSGGQAHSGFLKLAEALRPEVRKGLEELGGGNVGGDKEGDEGFQLWFGGHSLGGALAVLYGSMYEEKVAGVYTFGGPRVGNAKFAEGIAAMPLYRFVNDNDLIARLPTPPGYKHGGSLVVIRSDGALERDLKLGGQMKARWEGHLAHLREVFQKHWKEQDFSAIPSDYIVDHSPIRYVEFLKRYREGE